MQTETDADTARPEAQFVDRPIKSAKEDLLGRAPFARSLAQAILSWRGEESLTIGVSGDWGTGKTSLKNLVVEQLTTHGTGAPEIVEFNPWKWGTQDKLSEAFYREISIALRKIDTSLRGRRRAWRLRRYGRLLTFGSGVITDFGSAIPALLAFAVLCGLFTQFFRSTTEETVLTWVGIISAGIAAFLQFGGQFARRLANLITEGLEDEDQKSIEDRKIDLANDLSRLSKSVLIIIDDLDRISKEDTRRIIQHIKVNADFPHLIFLLLYNQAVVAAHLDDPPISGQDFLEKIIQLHFDIPALSRQSVQKTLFAGLDSIIDPIGNIEFDQARWTNLFLGVLTTYFNNLRT